MSHRALIAALAVSITALANPVLAQEKLVKLYTWSGYVSPTVLESFSRATGIKTVLETYKTKEEAAAKLASGNSGTDIVVLEAVPALASAVQAGGFQPLDAARLPALAGQDPALTRLLAGADFPTGSAGIYLWGTLGLAVRTDLIRKRAEDAPLNSYALLFDPRFAKKLQGCGIGLIDDPMIVLPMALRYLGLDRLRQGRLRLQDDDVVPGIPRSELGGRLVGQLIGLDHRLDPGRPGERLEHGRAQVAAPGVELDLPVLSEGVFSRDGGCQRHEGGDEGSDQRTVGHSVSA